MNPPRKTGVCAEEKKDTTEGNSYTQRETRGQKGERREERGERGHTAAKNSDRTFVKGASLRH
jgi:hypothetical protein